MSSDYKKGHIVQAKNIYQGEYLVMITNGDFKITYCNTTENAKGFMSQACQDI